MPALGPVIGLNVAVLHSSRHNGRAQIGLNYLDAIEAAGGVPLMLPPYEQHELYARALKMVDGICLIGGDDYHPDSYGGRMQRAEELLDERRHRCDWILAREVLKNSTLPVLGICGGCQLINIAAGGKLVQDLRSEWTPQGVKATLPHARKERPPRQSLRYRHPVTVQKRSQLAGLLSLTNGATVPTNSFHHQAVDPEGVGKGLCAVAWAPDGVVEAIEPSPKSKWAREQRFVLGVQWHPEKAGAEPASKKIFAAFIQAARKHGTRRRARAVKP